MNRNNLKLSKDFDPFKAPLTYRVYDKEDNLSFTTESGNDASDFPEDGKTIIATDTNGLSKIVYDEN